MKRKERYSGWSYMTSLLLTMSASGEAALAQQSIAPPAATGADRGGYVSGVIVKELFKFFEGGRAVGGTDSSVTIRSMLATAEVTSAVRKSGRQPTHRDDGSARRLYAPGGTRGPARFCAGRRRKDAGLTAAGL